MHLEMGSSTTFQVRIYGNEERKCMYGVDWVSNVSLFGDQRYFCTIGKYFPWWKQKCLEIVFQTFFSATKDISNLFTLFYIMILVFVRSLHSQPVRQSGACDGLRWVWTLWHRKTEGLDFFDSIWMDLCTLHSSSSLNYFKTKILLDSLKGRAISPNW